MIIIDSAEWHVFQTGPEEVEFALKIKNLSDAVVYDYTQEIETTGKQCMFKGDVFDITGYGVRQDYVTNVSTFYILGAPKN